MDPARWEHGSDFDWSLEGGRLEAPWSRLPHTLWGSGRDALRALLAWGRDERGWRRVLVPTFFCQEVIRALARELPIASYSEAPGDDPAERIDASECEVVVVVNTYGMRPRTRIETRASVVEDHTHDPLSGWAFDSDADYAVASLRKTLPLPDGGVLWSPRGRRLPAQRAATDAHSRATFDRLAAMLLKRHFLDGHAVDKKAYRALAGVGELGIGTGEISGMTPFSRERLPSMPARAWRDGRARGLAAFRAALGEVSGARLLEAPFAATLLFDTPALHERVRRALAGRRIYPAVLWSLESPAVHGVPERHVDLSRRVLSLHCDFRYGADDMRRVAAAVRSLLA
jgi:hypothetical protein